MLTTVCVHLYLFLWFDLWRANHCGIKAGSQRGASLCLGQHPRTLALFVTEKHLYPPFFFWLSLITLASLFVCFHSILCINDLGLLGVNPLICVRQLWASVSPCSHVVSVHVRLVIFFILLGHSDPHHAQCLPAASISFHPFICVPANYAFGSSFFKPKTNHEGREDSTLSWSDAPAG